MLLEIACDFVISPAHSMVGWVGNEHGKRSYAKISRRIQDRFRKYSCGKLFLREVIVMNDALKESNPKAIEKPVCYLGVIELSLVQFIMV